MTPTVYETWEFAKHGILITHKTSNTQFLIMTVETAEMYTIMNAYLSILLNTTSLKESKRYKYESKVLFALMHNSGDTRGCEGLKQTESDNGFSN